MFNVLDTVVLTRDVPEFGLLRGDLGAIVEVYGPNAFDVEFVAASGRTQALVTLTADHIRHVGDGDLVSRSAPRKGGWLILLSLAERRAGVRNATPVAVPATSISESRTVVLAGGRRTSGSTGALGVEGDAVEIVTSSVITCELWRADEEMPTDACLYFYECRSCKSCCVRSQVIAVSSAPTEVFSARQSSFAKTVAEANDTARYNRSVCCHSRCRDRRMLLAASLADASRPSLGALPGRSVSCALRMAAHPSSDCRRPCVRRLRGCLCGYGCTMALARRWCSPDCF
jgi:hypothetical protein